MPAWPQENLDTLRRLWAEGLTCSAIASELGGAYTRSAIIGKAHRLALPTRGARTNPLRAEKAKRHAALALPSAKPRRVKPNVHTIQKRADIRARDPGLTNRIAVVPTGPVVPRRIPLLELGRHDCRYIVEGAGAASLFCAVEVTDWFAGRPGGSYCAAHRQICSGRGTEGERSAHRAVAA